MKDSTRRKVGAGLAVGGAGIAFGAPAVSRIENKIASVKVGSIERKLAGVKAQMPKKPDASLRRVNGGKKTLPENPRDKIYRQDQTKKLHGQISELNRQKNAARKPKLYRNQTKLWATGLGVGVPTSYVGTREAVGKRATRSDVNGAYAGGVGAFAGYQGGSLALKPLDRRAERKISEDPDLKSKAENYRAKANRPKNATAGDPRWRPYFRNYPKDLPGGRLKRTLAVTHTGHSGSALTAGVTAAGAVGGVALMRHHEENKIKKSDTVSAFGVEH